MVVKRGDRDEADLVKLYLRDIGQYPLLTKDDEARLAQAIEAGREAERAITSDGSLTPAKKRSLRRAVAFVRAAGAQA